MAARRPGRPGRRAPSLLRQGWLILASSSPRVMLFPAKLHRAGREFKLRIEAGEGERVRQAFGDESGRGER